MNKYMMIGIAAFLALITVGCGNDPQSTTSGVAVHPNASTKESESTGMVVPKINTPSPEMAAWRSFCKDPLTAYAVLVEDKKLDGSALPAGKNMLFVCDIPKKSDIAVESWKIWVYPNALPADEDTMPPFYTSAEEGKTVTLKPGVYKYRAWVVFKNGVVPNVKGDASWTAEQSGSFTVK